MNVAEFCTIVFAICKIYGGSVTSWIRTDAHNKTVGGTPNTKHKDGRAVDIILDNIENQAACIEAFRACKLRAFWDRDHVHAETI